MSINWGKWTKHKSKIENLFPSKRVFSGNVKGKIASDNKSTTSRSILIKIHDRRSRHSTAKNTKEGKLWQNSSREYAFKSAVYAFVMLLSKILVLQRIDLQLINLNFCAFFLLSKPTAMRLLIFFFLSTIWESHEIQTDGKWTLKILFKDLKLILFLFSLLSHIL